MLDLQTPPKFSHPDVTAKGEPRASVTLKALETLWFNTGTLCNITCENCYILSSPSNDRLVYLGEDDVAPFLAEAKAMGTREIGFTGGEPYMNPAMNRLTEMALEAGFEVLVLTNAMRPMRRPKVEAGLLTLQKRFGNQLTLRVSLDHYSRELHEKERGPQTYEPTMEGLFWLSDNGFKLAAAGRTCWGEEESEARAGYARLFKERNIKIDANDPAQLVLFPEMDEGGDPPEITTACWDILGKDPAEIMCASSRMVVKRKGEAKASVAACTLLPYDKQFDLGTSLKTASCAVKLNHPFCAIFCVLGGGSCSV